ncbi:MAG: LysR family transcriptional regulator [Pseudomonadota bacterium]
MRVLCRVVELGSFVAVARESNLSTTMVSKHVAQLEKSLGVSLLNRTTRKVSLTEIGSNYYQRAKQLLEDLEELDGSVNREGATAKGLLKVNAPIDFGAMHMVPMIEAFQGEHPDLSLQLVLENRHIDLNEGVFDIAIRITITPEPGLIAKDIGSTVLATYASPAYLEKFGEPESVEMLHCHQCLHFLDTPHSEYWVFRKDTETLRFRPKWLFASNNGRVLCKAAARGMGIIQAPDVTVGPYVRTGQLKEILSEYRLPTVHIYATYLQRRFIPAKITAFVRFMADYFKSNQRW